MTQGDHEPWYHLFSVQNTRHFLFCNGNSRSAYWPFQSENSGTTSVSAKQELSPAAPSLCSATTRTASHLHYNSIIDDSIIAA